MLMLVEEKNSNVVDQIALFFSSLPCATNTSLARSHRSLACRVSITMSGDDLQDGGRNFAMVAGNGNRQLAEAIAQHVGISLMSCDVSKFTNSETRVKLNESVRGRPVTIICSPRPGHINDDLMEVLVLADTLRRSRFV